MSKNKRDKLQKRVIFFGDSNSYISTILFKEFIKEMDQNILLVAVVDTALKKKANIFMQFNIFLLKKVFNWKNKNLIFHPYHSFLKYVGHDTKILKTKNINSKEFMQTIQTLQPDIAFTMGCPQIFKKELIECFDMIVNYHNSYLPSYRGLEATSWAMTNEEKFTGYTFHYINEKIDDGNIVYQEKIVLDYTLTAHQNELIKTKKASKKIKQVLDLVYRGYKGKTQSGNISYFGEKEKNKLLTFSTLKDVRKINKLIDIWSYVILVGEKENLKITSISDNGKIKRISHLPIILYKTYKIIKKNWKKN